MWLRGLSRWMQANSAKDLATGLNSTFPWLVPALDQIRSDQSLTRVRLFATPCCSTIQKSSFTITFISKVSIILALLTQCLFVLIQIFVNIFIQHSILCIKTFLLVHFLSFFTDLKTLIDVLLWYILQFFFLFIFFKLPLVIDLQIEKCLQTIVVLP